MMGVALCRPHLRSSRSGLQPPRSSHVPVPTLAPEPVFTDPVRPAGSRRVRKSAAARHQSEPEQRNIVKLGAVRAIVRTQLRLIEHQASHEPPQSSRSCRSPPLELPSGTPKLRSSTPCAGRRDQLVIRIVAMLCIHTYTREHEGCRRRPCVEWRPGPPTTSFSWALSSPP